MTERTTKRGRRRYQLHIAGDRSPRSWDFSEAELTSLLNCCEEGIVMLKGGERSRALNAMHILLAAQQYQSEPEPKDAVTVYSFGASHAR